MPKYKKDTEEKKEKERQEKVLEYLDRNRGGKDIAAIIKGCNCGAEGVVRKTLANLETCRYVNVICGSYNHAHGGNRTRWYHITPEGVDRLYELQGKVTMPAKDWSQTPSLMDNGDTVAVSSTVAMDDAPVEMSVPEPEPVPVPDTDRQNDVDVDALGKALDALRAIDSGDDAIDFDIAALITKTEARIRTSIATCPHCGGEMAVQSVGENRMLICRGCCLAVTLKKNPKDLTALVRAWNKRV